MPWVASNAWACVTHGCIAHAGRMGRPGPCNVHTGVASHPPGPPRRHRPTPCPLPMPGGQGRRRWRGCGMPPGVRHAMSGKQRLGVRNTWGVLRTPAGWAGLRRAKRLGRRWPALLATHGAPPATPYTLPPLPCPAGKGEGGGGGAACHGRQATLWRAQYMGVLRTPARLGCLITALHAPARPPSLPMHNGPLSAPTLSRIPGARRLTIRHPPASPPAAPGMGGGLSNTLPRGGSTAVVRAGHQADGHTNTG